MKLYIESKSFVKVENLGVLSIKECISAALSRCTHLDGVTEVWVIDETVKEYPFDYIKALVYKDEIGNYKLAQFDEDQTFLNIWFNWDVFRAIKAIDGTFENSGELCKNWKEKIS